MCLGVIIDAKEKPQYFWNKKIPFIVHVKVCQNADFLEVRALTNSGEFIPGKYTFQNISKGNYTYKFYYIPKQNGQVSYNFVASIASQRTNYADSFSGIININKDLVRIPMTSGYLLYQIGAILVLFTILGIAVLKTKSLLNYIRHKLLPSLISRQVNNGI